MEVRREDADLVRLGLAGRLEHLHRRGRRVPLPDPPGGDHPMNAPYRIESFYTDVMPFHVVIIGGGLGGLTLEQGLRKAGVSVAVYERDRTVTSRLQGYRVHINPAGSRALHACLPPHLFEAFDRTCGASGRAFHFLTEHMGTLLSVSLSDME